MKKYQKQIKQIKRYQYRRGLRNASIVYICIIGILMYVIHMLINIILSV
jgi:hypothetical protein